MRKHVIGALAPLIAFATPLAAQEDSPATEESQKADPGEEAVAAMMAMFKAEPLTADQLARLPKAQALVARIMPPGTMDQMMGGMFDKMLGPMMALQAEPSSREIAEELGVEPEELELGDEDAAQAAAILDPAWKTRREREMAAVQKAVRVAMTAMEPAMRKGLAEAYAVAFTDTELNDIDAFFATPSGASYARKSYALASDPRIMAASFEAMPAMMAQMAVMEQEVKSATADLPPRRGYGDLSVAQRATLADLTGLSQDEIREGMAEAARKRAPKGDED